MKCFVPATLSIAASLALATQATASLAGSYVVGTGASASFVQIEFANANAYLYEVRYDGALFGDDLFAIIAQAQPGFFSYVTQSFSFGDALFGITIGGDTNEGFGTPPAYLDYWHYWTRQSSADAWTESFIGFGDRAVTNGSWDGWVFDASSAPQAVPAPGAIALAAVAVLGMRRRR